MNQDPVTHRQVFHLPFVLAVLLLSAAPLASQSGRRHPLDPLSREEIEAAAAVLRDAGRLGPAVRFAALELREPPKAQVLANAGAGGAERSAFALLYDWATRTASEAVVDLDRREVASWRSLPPGEP